MLAAAGLMRHSSHGFMKITRRLWISIMALVGCEAKSSRTSAFSPQVLEPCESSAVFISHLHSGGLAVDGFGPARLSSKPCSSVSPKKLSKTTREAASCCRKDEINPQRASIDLIQPHVPAVLV